MSTAKVAITLEEGLLERLDNLVRQHVFSNRSKAIQEAIKEKLNHIERSRLAQECKKLDPKFERSLAEEGFTTELDSWPEY